MNKVCRSTIARSDQRSLETHRIEVSQTHKHTYTDILLLLLLLLLQSSLGSVLGMGTSPWTNCLPSSLSKTREFNSMVFAIYLHRFALKSYRRTLVTAPVGASLSIGMIQLLLSPYLIFKNFTVYFCWMIIESWLLGAHYAAHMGRES